MVPPDVRALDLEWRLFVRIVETRASIWLSIRREAVNGERTCITGNTNTQNSGQGGLVCIKRENYDGRRVEPEVIDYQHHEDEEDRRRGIKGKNGKKMRKKHGTQKRRVDRHASLRLAQFQQFTILCYNLCYKFCAISTIGVARHCLAFVSSATQLAIFEEDAQLPSRRANLTPACRKGPTAPQKWRRGAAVLVFLAAGALLLRPAIFLAVFKAAAQAAGQSALAEPLHSSGQAEYGVLLLVSLWCHGLGIYLAGVCGKSHPRRPTLPLQALPPDSTPSTSHPPPRQPTSVSTVSACHCAPPVPCLREAPRTWERQGQVPHTTWSPCDNRDRAVAGDGYLPRRSDPVALPGTAAFLARLLLGVSVVYRVLLRNVLDPRGLGDVNTRLSDRGSVLSTWHAPIRGLAQSLGVGLTAAAAALVAGVTWVGPTWRYSQCGTREGSGVEAASLVRATPPWEYFAAGGYAHWVVRAMACKTTAAPTPGGAGLGLPDDNGSATLCQGRTRGCHVAVTVAVCALLLQALILHLAALIRWRTKLFLARHI